MSTDKPISCLLCYDIRDQKRLRRVHQVARNWGEAFQYSVFRCYLDRRDQRRMLAEIGDEIDPSVDDVRLYEIETRSPIRTLGAPFHKGGPVLHESD